jgi:hypothetical protein
MKTRTKVLVVILLAIGYWMWMQHDTQHKADGGRKGRKGCVSQVRLLEWYNNANEDYFDNALPKGGKIEIVWEDLRYVKAMGDTDCNEQGCRIRLDPYVNAVPATAEETLLHEMCHVATQGVDFDHGPEFQSCMTMLFNKGALKGLI